MVLGLVALWTPGIRAQVREPVVVNLDVSEVPKLAEWGKQAKTLMVEWHPRLDNMIPSKDFVAPREMDLMIRNSDEGVGGTTGTKIALSSRWIEDHPNDFGLVIHEMVHVIQAYPNGQPSWVTEGIADYLRWGIFEGKPLSEFPKPMEKDGYRRGYQVAAGFLLWLESDRAPGIVKRLNTAMRQGKYRDTIFEEETGISLSKLWDQYTGTE